MFDFFRKYQWYFFLVITVVIIISFSFFGTYSTLGSNTWREQIAFKAVNGQEVTRAELDEMAQFIGTDAADKQFYGGVWGPNFLNDGVIRKEFFETGLAQELVLAYQEDLQADMEKRHAKEKKYTLYAHPQAHFLNVENIWSYFAPEMSRHFDALQSSKNPLDQAAFNHRVKLYLEEKKLPSSILKNILRYQEKQYSWIKPDEDLNQRDLSLFGYHTIEDWFGAHFTRLVSEFIINAAILAEAQGYEVSKAEVLTDLIRNTQTSYQENLNNPNLGVASPEQYMSEQLRRMNMDQSRAIKVWRQVLLFRRYFQDGGATALLDRLMNQILQQFVHENISVDLYRLPRELNLANYEALQNFETYLYAVAIADKKNPLALPQQFLSVSEVLKEYPELVQKKYDLEVAQTTQKAIQARIGLRDLWNWEVADENWPNLKKQFSSLATNEDDNRDARFAILDGLDTVTRSKVDAFAKQAIVKEHPEWIQQALEAATPQKMSVGLRTQGGKMPFAGLDQKSKRRAFLTLLDEAPLGSAVASDSPLAQFSDDQQTFYRIAVLDRAKDKEILTFAQAQADGTLNELRPRMLENYYVANRQNNPTLYKRGENEWQSFKNVRELVADEFFKKTLDALEPIQKEITAHQDEISLSNDQAASLRFYPYLKKIKAQLEKDPSQATQWVREENGKNGSLEDQWKIERSAVKMNRQRYEEGIDIDEVFAEEENSWSPLKKYPDGRVAFYQVKNPGMDAQQPEIIAKQVREAQAFLGAEAQRQLMSQVLKELKEKHALSLAYLNTPNDAGP